MEEQLIALLLGAAGVTALVSDRINWGTSPQGTARPYIVLHRVSGLHDYHMQGSSGYVASRVQIDVYSEKYTTTKQAARAVIAALSGYKGGVFQGIFIDSERDLPAVDAGEVSNLFRTSIDIMIHQKSE